VNPTKLNRLLQMFVRGKDHDSDYKTLKELHAPAVLHKYFLSASTDMCKTEVL
jgi:hypothetical protein